MEALDAQTGDVAWQVEPLGGYGSAPLVHRGSVYVMFGVSPNEAEGRLVALDAETGAILHSVSAQQAFFAPVLALDGDYLTASSSIIEVRRLSSLKRTFWLGSKNSRGVAMRDGNVYAASASEALAFDVGASRPWGDRFRRTWQIMHLRGMAPAPPACAPRLAHRRICCGPIPACRHARRLGTGAPGRGHQGSCARVRRGALGVSAPADDRSASADQGRAAYRPCGGAQPARTGTRASDSATDPRIGAVRRACPGSSYGRRPASGQRNGGGHRARCPVIARRNAASLAREADI